MAVQQLDRLIELVRLDGLLRAVHVRGVSQLAGFERFSFGAGRLSLRALALGGFGVARLIDSIDGNR
jgi:hypothetical protein